MTLITHSLLSSWLWTMNDVERDTQAEFLRVLNREKTEPSEAMLKGIEFEDLVTDIVNGVAVKDGKELNQHKWFSAALKAADLCVGGQLQLVAKQETVIDNYPVLLYGRLDCLKAGTIYDIKFSTGYSRGKFIGSTQHPMYLELVPEALEFTYIVSNGSEVWTETYRRDEAMDIRKTVSEFFQWLKNYDLLDLYQEKWQSK